MRGKRQPRESVSFKADLEVNDAGDRWIIRIRRETRTWTEDSLGREHDRNWTWDTIVVMSVEQAANLAGSIADMLGYLATYGGDRHELPEEQ